MFESITYLLPRILSNSFSSTIKLLWIRNSLLDNLLTTIRLNSQLFLPVTSLSAIVQSLTSHQFLWTLAEPLNFVLAEIYLCRDMSWTFYLLISDIHRVSIRLILYAINGWAFFYKKMLLHHVLKMIQVIPKLDTRIWHWKLELASIAMYLGLPYFFSHGKTFNKKKKGSDISYAFLIQFDCCFRYRSDLICCYPHFNFLFDYYTSKNENERS